MKAQRRVFVIVLLAVLALATSAPAQLAVTSNDNKVMLDNGTVKIVPNPRPDTVTIIDLKASPPRLVAEIAAPGSVVGPPLSVALTPDESLALVGSSSRVDPSDPTKTVPDTDVSSKGDFAAVANIGLGQGDTDTVSLIDVRARPPRVVETVSVGQTPEGIKVSPDGRHVAVVVMNGSNKAKESPFYADHGKLVVLRAKGMKLTKVAEAPIGHWSQGAAFSPDGKTILVGNMVEKDVQVFSFDGRGLKEIARIKVNGGPAAVRTAEK